jgi:pyruvoyl-dependent arginine decarboxylase (PvlArgDC)
MLPTKVYFGCACGNSPIGDKCAKDLASAEMGVAECNLEDESSILAPGIRIIDRAEFETLIRPGMTLKAIHGVCTDDEPGRLVCAGLAVVIPRDPSLTGFVAELFKTPGIVPEMVQRRVEEMALQIFARYRGLNDPEFDARTVWELGKVTYEIGEATVDVKSWIAHTVVNRDGDDACAFVMAALLP